MSQKINNQNSVNEEMERMINEYQAVSADKDVREKLLQRMLQAKEDKKMRNRSKLMKIGASVAAAVCVLMILPNSSLAVANAMGNLPVVGKLFRVITFRDYEVEGDNYYADVKVPKIETEESETTTETNALQDVGTKADTSAQSHVNKSVEEYIDELVEKFNREISENEEARQGLDVSYDVLTNTDRWFTLRINVLETAASGYEYSRIYHINKESDQVADLNDLFAEGSDYVDVISNYIKDEMRRRMQESEDVSYFIDSEPAFADDDFQRIRENQNFYFNSDGQLVIVFDEYEVAPGYMGAVEFAIPDEVISDIIIQRP